MANRDVSEPTSLRALGLTTLTLGLLLSMLFSYVAHGALRTTPLSLPMEDQIQTQRWVPQGWAFFTRDPREPRTLFFRRGADGKWQSASLAPHAAPHNAFGLNRASRAQGVELAQLLRYSKASHWRDCSAALELCSDHLDAPRAIANHAAQKTLCGELLIVKQKPLPWAWRNFSMQTVMPRSILRLEVSC